MIIYWSMILWVLLIYFVYSMGHKEEVMLTDYNIQQGIQKKIPLAYAIVVFGYFIFWIGMRKYVADTTVYINMFQSIPTNFSTAWNQINWEGKNPGFDIFNIFFKCFISQDFQWWLITIAIISGVCIMVVLRKYSCDFFFSSFLFMTLLTFQWMINGMRQFICVAVLFLCCDWIKDGKFIRFLLAVLLMSTFHMTALLMIPIYFVARSKPWDKKIGLFIIGIILICIFAEPFFSGVDSALGNTAYAGATSQFEEDDGVNPLKFLFIAIPTVIAFWKRNTLKSYYETNAFLPVCINMSLIASALYFVGMFTSGILIGRLPIYAEVYDLILIPYLLNVCFSKTERSIIKPVYILVLILFFYLLSNGMGYHSDITGYIS
ncbi:MAG: EpsG family protein [Ruminococcus sp.]